MINFFITNIQLFTSKTLNVDYLWIIVMFLSAVWTLIPTAPIHYKNVFWWTNNLIYILDGLRVSSFIFGWTIPLSVICCCSL